MSEILIVDDDQPTRELLRRWLSAEGFAISEAPDAESALTMLAERSIAVATIDKDMPGHDGTWLVEQIQKAHPAVAMLLATGDDAIAPRISLSRGIQGYLVKPFTRELVVGAVKDAVVWHEVAAKQRAHSLGPDEVK
jgi:DNA-binding NtrC family response regulator